MAYSNPVLAKKIEEQIVTARVGLLISQPFWGNLATRLKLVDATDDGWCTTAATDGKHLYYNRDFVAKLDIGETQFLVGHEIGHCVLDHFGRRGARNPDIWNIAGDYVINGELVDAKIGKMIRVIKPLWDTKYRGKFTEEVYDELLKNAKTIDISQLGTLDQHLPLEGDQQQNGAGESDANSNNQDQNQKNGKGQNGNDSKNGGGQADGDDQQNKASQMPTISKEQVKDLRDEFREAVIAAASAAGAGNTPGFVKKLIKDFTESKMNWKDLIRQQIQSIIRSDFTWARPSRKTWSTGVYLPGMDPEQTIDVCVAVDTSGSTQAMVKDFISEIKGIMEQFRDFKVKIWTFDTECYNVKDFDEHTRHDMDTYEAMGGGGTDFMANWRFMRDNDIQPKKLIVFTDGYPFGAWGEPDYCDVVWVIHGADNVVPPFGAHAYYPKDKKARN